MAVGRLNERKKKLKKGSFPTREAEYTIYVTDCMKLARMKSTTRHTQNAFLGNGVEVWSRNLKQWTRFCGNVMACRRVHFFVPFEES